jgi:hypothetical protein
MQPSLSEQLAVQIAMFLSATGRRARQRRHGWRKKKKKKKIHKCWYKESRRMASSGHMINTQESRGRV